MAVYDANPEEMARRTRILEAVATGVAKVFGDHQNRCASIGNVWGTDELGLQFASRYVPSQKQFDEFSGNVVTGVRTSVDAVVDSAHQIHVTEQNNTLHGAARPK